MVVVSHKHKFVFVKGIRTASSSMEEFFWRFRGVDDIFTPWPPKWDKKQNHEGKFDYRKDIPYAQALHDKLPKWGITDSWYRKVFLNRINFQYQKKKKFYDHMTAWQIRNRIGKDVYDRYFTFCFERNPFSKVVSRWMYYRKIGKINFGFREFVKSHWLYDALNFVLYWDPIKEEIMVDFIGHYENLEEDFAKAMERIGLPTELDVRINTASNGNYRRFYDSELKEIVGNVYRFELELWGYEF